MTASNATPPGTPSEAAVESDFTVPEEADLSPAGTDEADPAPPETAH